MGSKLGFHLCSSTFSVPLVKRNRSLALQSNNSYTYVTAMWEKNRFEVAKIAYLKQVNLFTRHLLGTFYMPGCSLVAQPVKNLRAMRETWVCFLGWEDLGEFHGQRSLADYSPWVCKELDTTEWLSVHFCVPGSIPTAGCNIKQNRENPLFTGHLHCGRNQVSSTELVPVILVTTLGALLTGWWLKYSEWGIYFLVMWTCYSMFNSNFPLG